MKVKDVMTKHPITIDAEAPVGTALESDARQAHPPPAGPGRYRDAHRHHHRSRPPPRGALAPALDEYLSVRAHRRGRQLSETLENLRVKDVMTWAVVTTGPEAPLTYAALIMFESRVGSLPVVEQGRLVGILTEQDVLKALLLEGEIAEFSEGYMW